jgi:hypothetical protein
MCTMGLACWSSYLCAGGMLLSNKLDYASIFGIKQMTYLWVYFGMLRNRNLP